METLGNYAWIVIIILLLWICYRLWKRGKYRDPGQENTYFDGLKKRSVYECPFDREGRSCKYVNGATGYKDKVCSNCDWYGNGVRPSKF